MSTSFVATVVTLYPEMFPGPLGYSLAGAALARGLWTLDTIDLRAYGSGKRRDVDDTPAGGGEGMILRADVLAPAIDVALMRAPNVPVLLTSPRGRPFAQTDARHLAEKKGVIIICGRFEGVDERIIESRGLEERSIGDYVLSGGELAAQVMIDAAVRLMPGVMGNARSSLSESFEQDLLEYPQYTRPRSFEGREIPDVLLSGNHERIARWRREQAEALTRARRQDLWRKRQGSE